MARLIGHKQGARRVKEIVKTSPALGIFVLATQFAPHPHDVVYLAGNPANAVKRRLAALLATVTAARVGAASY